MSMCKLFVNILILSYTCQIVSASCSSDTGDGCSWFGIDGCPSNSDCQGTLGWGQCHCTGNRVWVNGACGNCGSFTYCSSSTCVYKSGACSDCPQPQQECSRGRCVWSSTYCGSGADCPNNQFCKKEDESDWYGRCVACPNNQDTFCSIMGLDIWSVIQDCYTECGAGSQPNCECLQSWTVPEDGGNCDQTQYGCPSVSCDEGLAAYRWCSVSNRACAQSAQDGWHMFCDSNTPSNGCYEWGNCGGNSFCDYGETNYEGGQYGQCITCASIGNDCLNSNLPDSGASSGVAECQHTCNACYRNDMNCPNNHFCHFDWPAEFPGFCDTCESISSCGSISDSNSRTQCEEECECQDSSDCSSGTFCDLHSDSPAQGICHSCPSSKNTCFGLGLLGAQHECEMKCFPCSASSSCQSDYYCNFDRGTYGFCEDCDDVTDCTTEGINTAAGEQDCRDVCKKFPTNLPTDMPSTSRPTHDPTTEDPTKFPSRSPTFSLPTKHPTKMPTTEQPTGIPSVSPSIDCPGKQNEANCRSNGCAWLAHEERCAQECVKEENVETHGEAIEAANIPATQDSIEDCEVTCIEASYCERYTYRADTKKCTLFSSYYAETRDVEGIVTGHCLVTFEPTPMPTLPPTVDEPSTSPTQFPTSDQPTVAPTFQPTVDDPTVAPSVDPTVMPSTTPSVMPTAGPTTDDPTVAPSVDPTVCPSTSPTVMPTQAPTFEDPTTTPTVNPSSSDPTFSPHTSSPSRSPSLFPSRNPSGIPSYSPQSSSPTKSPSITPSTTPTVSPSVVPSTIPTVSPSVLPSTKPTTTPSMQPTADSPSTSPSTSPSKEPTSSFPTSMPTGTGVVDADVEFVGNYNQVIGTNKDEFLEQCTEALNTVECRDVRPGSIILTIRGSEENVNAAKQSILDDGLTLPGFASFTVTDDYAAANTVDSTPADTDEKFWETDLIYFIMGGIIVSFCICLAVFYSCFGEKQAEVIDLAQVYDGDDTDFIVPDEGFTEGGTDTDRGGADMIELATKAQGNVTPGEGGDAPLPNWPGDVREKESEIDPLYKYAKRTPGSTNLDSEEGHNVQDDEEPPKRRARPMSQHQREIEEGLFGKSQDLIAYEHPEGGDTGKNVNAKVGGAAFNPPDNRVGGMAFDKPTSPSTDGEMGLYDGPSLAAKTGSEIELGEGGSQKRLIKNGRKNEDNTRISLSMSDDEEPQYNVQHLYDKTMKDDEGGEIIPQKPNEGAELELPDQTKFETNPSLHL